jgi:hypothetical protein
VQQQAGSKQCNLIQATWLLEIDVRLCGRKGHAVYLENSACRIAIGASSAADVVY